MTRPDRLALPSFKAAPGYQHSPYPDPKPRCHDSPLPLDESPDTTANQAIFRHITCEKCGKRLLVEAQTGTQTHRCPICQAMLQTTFCDGHLTVTLAG